MEELHFAVEELIEQITDILSLILPEYMKTELTEIKSYFVTYLVTLEVEIKSKQKEKEVCLESQSTPATISKNIPHESILTTITTKIGSQTTIATLATAQNRTTTTNIASTSTHTMNSSKSTRSHHTTLIASTTSFITTTTTTTSRSSMINTST